MRRVALAIVAVAVVLAACTSDDGGDDSAPTTTEGASSSSTTTATTEPESDDVEPTTTTTEPSPAVGSFVEDDDVCIGLVLEVDLTCGFVVVPADHDDPDGERLRIAVARLGSTSPNPEPDPVVYLEGGPGGNAIDGLAFGSISLFETLLEERDVIVVDQRGVGLSDPALDCPEVDELGDEVSARADRTDADEDAAILDGLDQCFDRFRDDGIDPAWFTTAANADDIELVRQALGIDEWNLFGISYGTRLGLEVLRRHPDAVRSAVLDSVLPPEAEVVFGSAAGFQASFEAVTAVCAADPACSAGGELDERLVAAVESLDADPLAVDVGNPLTLDQLALFADGDLLLGVVSQALYDPTFFVDLPTLLDEIEERETAALSTFLSIELINRDFVSVGMFAAVACADEVVVTDPSLGSPAGTDELWVRAIDGVNVGSQAFDACATVGIEAPSADASEPVVSDVPTLVLSGAFDPITPPSYGEDAAEDLADAVVVEHPFLSHATASDPCVSGIVAAFVAAPTDPVDTGCIDEAVAPELTPVGIGDTTLETVSVEASVLGPGITAELPSSWLDQDVGFGLTRARLRGVLDAASVSIFAGDDATMGFLTDSVAGVLDDVAEAEPIEVDGVTWERTTARDGSAVVDLFVDASDPDAVIVAAVTSAEDERDELLSAIVEPVLASIEVDAS
ncbi:MAG: alpha/beta fold hydrolase [Actinomycetota bacterium]